VGFDTPISVLHHTSAACTPRKESIRPVLERRRAIFFRSRVRATPRCVAKGDRRTPSVSVRDFGRRFGMACADLRRESQRTDSCDSQPLFALSRPQSGIASKKFFSS
jgi:hypothetical protein